MVSTRSKYSLLGRFNFEDLYNAFLGLEERRQLLIASGAAVIFILILVLPISCASSKLGRLEREYDRGRKGQESLMSKINEYQSSKIAVSRLQKNLSASSGGGSLTTIIESVANEAGIGQNIDRLKPVNLGTTEYFEEEGIDGVISKVSLDQLIDFLYRIDNHDSLPMKFSKLDIKTRYGKRDLMTVSFQLTTRRYKGEEGE